MKKRFDEWNGIKKQTELSYRSLAVKQREVYVARLGENVGHEQCGKGEYFLRPVLIFRKFSNSICLVIPLSKTKKRGEFYFGFSFVEGVKSVALLSQIRMIDSKRLERKLGKMKQEDFNVLKNKIASLLGVGDFFPPAGAGVVLGENPSEFVPALYRSKKELSNSSIVLLGYNIRSLWNVGSLFRTSDAFGVEKIYLSGYTATPPRREISKTAIGAEEWIPWAYEKDPTKVITNLKENGYSIIGLELTSDAVDISNFNAPEKVCLLLGHEVTGIPQELLALCDQKVQIPMKGKKESLNVAVTAGIALFQISS